LAFLLAWFLWTPDTNGFFSFPLTHRNVLNVGLMCTVDLFPVPDSTYDIRSPASQSPEPLSHSSRIIGGNALGSGGPSGINRGAGGGAYQQQQAQPTLTYFPLHPYMSLEANGSQTPTLPFQIPRRQLMLSTVYPSEMPNDIIHRIGSHLVTESSKLTPALIGEKFAEPTLVDLNGRKAFVFVFGVSNELSILSVVWAFLRIQALVCVC